MILHRLHVENWRSLRDPIELLDLSHGLNVIFGPNEIGKSTLMDAICRGFFDRHGTGGTSMVSRQPWGSSLGPGVTIEFERAGQRYRLCKRFLVDAQCELAQWREDGWERVAQGKTADERIIELAWGDSSGRGLSKPEHWGLGQVLWTQQGRAADLSVGDSQQARLRDALRITLDSTQGETIEKAVLERYEKVYTSQGRYRGGGRKPAVVQLDEDLEQAQQQALLIQQRMTGIDQVAHDLMAAEDEHEQASRELAQTQRDRSEKRQELDGLQQKQSAYERLKAAATEARAGYDQHYKHSKRIREADEGVTEAREAVKHHQGIHADAKKRLEPAQTVYDQLNLEWQERIDALNRCEKELVCAERRLRWIDCRERLDQLTKHYERIRHLQKQVSLARKELKQLAAPSEKQLAALRKLNERIRQKKAELKAASLSTRIEPQRKLVVEIEIDDEKRTNRQISEAFNLNAVSTIGLNIDEVGRIVIRSGKSNATKLNAELSELNQRWIERTTSLASDDLNSLEKLATERTLLEHRVEQMGEQIAQGDDDKTVQQKITELEQTRKLLLAEDRDLEHGLNTNQNAQAAQKQAKQRRQNAHGAQANAEAAVKGAEAALLSARERAMGARSRLGEAQAVLSDREREAKRLRAEDEVSDVDRKAKLTAMLQAKDEANQRLEAAERLPLERFAKEIQQLQAREDRLQSDLRDLAGRIGRLKREVELAGGEGHYSQYVVAVEREDDLKRRLDRARIDAEAIKLLWETLRRHKQDVFDAVLNPVRQMVITSMQHLVGPRYERIDFGEQLTPTSVRPTGRDAEAAVDDLSFGTREQVMLLVRLALARLMARDGDRQCVILDDPLVNADRSRQRAALRILEEAAVDTQILIFTCHPVAYEGLEHVTRFDLQVLLDLSRVPGSESSRREAHRVRS